MKVGWNPIVARDLGGDSRATARLRWLTLWLLALCGLFVIAYWTVRSESGVSVGSSATVAPYNQVFAFVVGAEMLFALVAVPGGAASAFAGERERQTLDVLLVTPLSPARLTRGKVATACAFPLLFLVAALPMQAAAAVLGGVGLQTWFMVTVILATTTIALAVFTVWLSAYAGSSRTVIWQAYGSLLGLNVVLPIIALAVGPAIYFGIFGSPSSTTAEAAWTAAIADGIVSLDPWYAFTASLEQPTQGTNLAVLTSPGVVASATHTSVQPWLVLLVCYIVIGAALFRLTVRRVRRLTL